MSHQPDEWEERYAEIETLLQEGATLVGSGDVHWLMQELDALIIQRDRLQRSLELAHDTIAALTSIRRTTLT